MKSKSVFKALPPEDQQRILDLCARHTYDEVLEIIARPRPEGLQLKTSYSALCRFNCAENAETRKAVVINQAAASLQYVRQRGSGAVRTAILGLLEERLLQALRAGKPVTDLKDEFAALKDFHKSFLAEEKWRHDPESRSDQESRDHHSRSLKNNHYDFVPLDEHGQPIDIPPLSEDEITSLNQTDDITAEDLARLDYEIAAFGPSVEDRMLIAGYPKDLIHARIQAWRENLQARGVSPVQAAIEARRAKLLPPSAPELSLAVPVRRLTEKQQQIAARLDSFRTSAEEVARVLKPSPPTADSPVESTKNH